MPDIIWNIIPNNIRHIITYRIRNTKYQAHCFGFCKHKNVPDNTHLVGTLLFLHAIYVRCAALCAYYRLVLSSGSNGNSSNNNSIVHEHNIIMQPPPFTVNLSFKFKCHFPVYFFLYYEEELNLLISVRTAPVPVLGSLLATNQQEILLRSIIVGENLFPFQIFSH